MHAHLETSGSENRTSTVSGLNQDSSCWGSAVWSQVIANVSHSSGSALTSSANGTNGGIIAGADHRFGGGQSVGIAVAYTDNKLSQTALSSSGNAWFVSLYGGVKTGDVSIDGQAFYMGSQWSMKRSVAGYGVASSSPNGGTGGGSVQISYPVQGTGFNPYARVSFASFDRRSTVEYGPAIGPLALAVSSGTTASTVAEAGVKWGAAYKQPDGMVVAPELQVAVQQDLSSNDRTVASRLVLIPGTDFRSAATKPDQTSVALSGTLKAQMSGKFDLFTSLRTRFSGNQSEGSIAVGGAIEF